MPTTEPTLAQLDGRPSPPPLRVHHILVATAVTAVMLSTANVLRHSDIYELSDVMLDSEGVLTSILTGLALTVIAFGSRWRHNGMAFFDQPGQWLLLQQALMGCLMVIAAWGGIVVSMGWSEEIAMWSGIAIGVFMIVMFVSASMWAAIKGADSIWWRAVFASIVIMFLAVGGTVIAGLEDTEVLELCFSAGMASMLLAAVVDDRRSGRMRHWTHWLGILFVASIPRLRR